VIGIVGIFLLSRLYEALGKPAAGWSPLKVEDTGCRKKGCLCARSKKF
jgi:hypothetical protein